MRRLNWRAGAAIAVAFAIGTLTSPLTATTLPKITLQPGDEVTIVAALPSASPSPTAAPTASPTPVPASPSPTLGPPPPSASPNATPGPTQIACGTSLQSVVDAAPAGSTLDLGACSFSGASAVVSITKPLTILRGVIRPSGFDAVAIRSNDVTIDGAAFDGGGWTIRIFGVDRTKILRSTFRNMREVSIYVQGPGADDTLIEGNTITQSVVTTHGYSPISGRGGATGGICCNTNLVIRGNTIDNGPSGVAWFGIEVWDNVGLVIEQNQTKGCGPHFSIPRSDGGVIRNNVFDHSCGQGWGGEIADDDNVQVVDNTFIGVASPAMTATWSAFVQIHPGSGTSNGVQLLRNRASNYPALFNNPPKATTAGLTQTAVTAKDNCLQNVGRLFWADSNPPAVPPIVSNNGPCP